MSQASGRAAGGGAAPLLVLGAGEDQLAVYREARSRGLPTIAVDQRLDRPALPLAERFLHVSTRDAGAISAALGPIALSGVVSAASDACLSSWHALSHRYRTAYRFPRDAALVSGDKVRFREFAEEAGVRGYGWASSGDPAELLDRARRLRFPVVSKPTDGSGSRGTTLVRDPGGLPAALAHSQANSASGTVIVEEFVEGRNLTVEIFMREGIPHFVPITEKRLVPGPRFLIGGHTCPAPIEEETRERLIDTAARLCAAMGVVDGPVNFDMILPPDGTPYVLEAGARLCGNGYPALLRSVYGVDTVGALVSLVLAEPFDLTPSRSGCGILHVLTSPLDGDGLLDEVSGVEQAKELPGVVDVEVFAKRGDLVRPFTQSANKLGYVVVRGETHSQSEATLERALRALRVTVAPRMESEPVPSAVAQVAEVRDAASTGGQHVATV